MANGTTGETKIVLLEGYWILENIYYSGCPGDVNIKSVETKHADPVADGFI